MDQLYLNPDRLGRSAAVSIRSAAWVERSSLSMQAAPLGFLSTTAFFGDGGTYGNLILDGAGQNYFQAGSNQTTILNNFTLVHWKHLCFLKHARRRYESVRQLPR